MESDADEEGFDDNATFDADESNFNIAPFSPAPSASDPDSDSEFQVFTSSVHVDGPSPATQPSVDLHSESSTSTPLECPTLQIEPTLDSDSQG